MKLDYRIKYMQFQARELNVWGILPSGYRMHKLMKEGWFPKLEESIVNEGIRNPILIWAKDNELKVRYGGCRVFIAQKYDMKIWAIVADYCGMFDNIDDIDPITIGSYFNDNPSIRISQERLNISACIDYHMIGK